MPDALLVFSIGPVQGFISEARRGQDLWAGSGWLSLTVRAALKKCLAEGAHPIFPASADQGSVPNRFVVRLPSAEVERVANAAIGAAREAFGAPALTAQADLKRKAGADRQWEQLWERQLAAHLEFFWAAAALGDDYQASYQEAERAFEAAKRTRSFEQVSEDGLKDSLSGSRSALRTGKEDAQSYWARVANTVNPSVLAAGGRERLDALGATKRFGFPAQTFPSVSTVAAGAFLLAAAQRCPEKLRAHAAAVGRLGAFEAGPLKVRLPGLAEIDWPYDGNLLYEETFTPETLRDEYGIAPGQDELATARETLESLVRAVGRPPSRYYAILQMDGNAMGRHVWECASQKQHTDLSQRLARFAALATDLIEQQRVGRLVYAGGDDLLALLALDDAVPAACDLAEQFGVLFEDWPAAPGEDGLSVPFSLRGGVAVAHHRYPLSAALEAAHQAEGAARRDSGEAGVAVRVLVRSGAQRIAAAPAAELKARFGEACELFAQDKMSPRLAYNVTSAAAVLEPPAVPEEAFVAEVRRVARRQRNTALLSEEEADRFAANLSGWGRAAGLGPSALADWLLVASFVARGGVQ